MSDGIVCQQCFNEDATMQHDDGEYLCFDCYNEKGNTVIIHQPVPDFLFNVNGGDIAYDIETFPNVFTFRATHCHTKQKWKFEISFRRNDLVMLCLFIERCAAAGCRWVGYNSVGFDYPVVHWIYRNQAAFISVADIYDKAMSIINAPFNARFAHMVWESDWMVPQIDLYRIHHFDNPAKATSLKVLEFNMRMDNIEDLPFPVGTMLNSEQADVLLDYNDHDVDATVDFYHRTVDKIKLREELSAEFNMSMMNCSDIKIGEKILIHQMEAAGIKCYEYVNNKKTKRQTKRDQIVLADVIFDYIQLEHPSFRQIQEHLASKVITETKGVFNGLIATVDGVDYKFGTGGLHASVESQVIHSDERYQIVDVDVAGFYVSLAIENRLYPEHLGEGFCDAYSEIPKTRKTYAKGTGRNEAYKLAGNGAYGNSNNDYSPFLDPQYTMSVTINGQLMLCMLTEQLLKVPGLKMIQANTDGITYLCPREYLDHTRAVCRWWEQLTSLELEEALYSRMFIRDVNSYAAEYEDGKIKRIGAYAYETAEENPGTRELPYHKDWSAIVVAKAAEAALVHGADIREFITSHGDIFDFFLRTKVPRSSTLEWGGEQVSNIVRFYVSTGGKPLEKVMPPAGPMGEYKRANKLTDGYFNEVMSEIGYGVWDERVHTKNKSTYIERRTGICTGWKVNICNKITLPCAAEGQWVKDRYFSDINYDWYVAETEKLVKPLLTGTI